MLFRPLILIGIFFALPICAPAQEMDEALPTLAKDLAGQIKEREKKKVSVLDFTDLQGNFTELGRYIAEELTVSLVLAKADFSVLDRANLRRILAEHKLTAKGLVDPENAKKLGQFAGVDAIVLGTITPKGSKIGLTTKIITTDTAEIVGAARAEFTKDDTVANLLAQVANAEEDTATSVSRAATGNARRDKGRTVKKLGDVEVAFSLGVVNGESLLLDANFTNTNDKKSAWVAFNIGGLGGNQAVLTDPEGNEYRADWRMARGIEQSHFENGHYNRATEIPPKETLSGTIRFDHYRSNPSPGNYRLEIEILVGEKPSGKSIPARNHHLVIEVPVS